MHKEIQILYTIFELELNPPFSLVKFSSLSGIYNKHSVKIGWYGYKKQYDLHQEVTKDIQGKIKRTFNVDKLSDDDVYHIAKHLFNWAQDKFPDGVKTVQIINYDTGQKIYYPNKEIMTHE